MKVGIICERQRKKFIFGRTRVITLAHPNGFDAIIAELGVSAARLEKIKAKRPKKYIKIMRRAERELISRCVKNAVIANSLKNALRDFSFNCVSVAHGENCFHKFLPYLIRYYKDKCGIGNNASLGIRDLGAGRRTEFLVDALYRDFKNINIYVENPLSNIAERLSERVFDETGLLLGLYEPRQMNENRAEDVFADLKNNRLRVGRDVLVNKIEPDLDLLGLDIDPLDLFAAAEMKNCAVKSCEFC